MDATHNPVVLDMLKMTLRRGPKAVKVRPKHAEMLRMLSAGRWVGATEVERAIWGGDGSSLNNAVFLTKHALGEFGISIERESQLAGKIRILRLTKPIVLATSTDQPAAIGITSAIRLRVPDLVLDVPGCSPAALPRKEGLLLRRFALADGAPVLLSQIATDVWDLPRKPDEAFRRLVSTTLGRLRVRLPDDIAIKHVQHAHGTPIAWVLTGTIQVYAP